MAFKKMTTTKALENAIKYISEQPDLTPEMERTIKMLKQMQAREKRANLRRTTRN